MYSISDKNKMMLPLFANPRTTNALIWESLMKRFMTSLFDGSAKAASSGCSVATKSSSSKNVKDILRKYRFNLAESTTACCSSSLSLSCGESAITSINLFNVCSKQQRQSCKRFNKQKKTNTSCKKFYRKMAVFRLASTNQQPVQICAIESCPIKCPKIVS